jgi:hypothetical protein
VDGLSLALQAASSDTSTSTTATIQASYAIVPDFFNGLLASEPRSTCAQEGENHQIPAGTNEIATYWRAWLGPFDGQPMLSDDASLEKFR